MKTLNQNRVQAMHQHSNNPWLRRVLLTTLIFMVCLTFFTSHTRARELTPADPEVTAQEGDTVDEDGEKDASANDESTAKSVKQVGDKIRVDSITFKPPQQPKKYTFKDFPSGNYVDVVPGNVAQIAPHIDPLHNNANSICVYWLVNSDYLTADQWPLLAEGNLEPPKGGKGSIPEAYWASTVKAENPLVDLDIDSDNDEGFGAPSRTLEDEEYIEEDDTKPGKVLVVNNDDGDEDGVTDFADGYNRDNNAGNADDAPPADENFVQVVIEIKEPIDLSKATLKLSYSDSDPDGVTNTTPPVGQEKDTVYTPAAGYFRLWMKNGAEERDERAFNDEGDFVPASGGEPYGPDDLEEMGFGGSGNNREVTLYLEAVRLTDTDADRVISIEVDPDGESEDEAEILTDTIVVTTLQVQIDVDTNRDGAIDLKDEAGEHQWEKERGSIYSVNLDRDGDREANLNGDLATKEKLGDTVYFSDSGFVDFEDFEINGEDDEEDITPINIRKLVPADLPDFVKVFLVASDTDDLKAIHLFHHIDDGEESIWGSVGLASKRTREIDITDYVAPQGSQYVDHGDGASYFGIEGMLFRFEDGGPGGVTPPARQEYDGQINITIELRHVNGEVIAKDVVNAKVAPWMMLTRESEGEAIYIENHGSNADLRATLAAAGGMTAINDYISSQWVQDHMEIGYTQRPGGPKTHIILRLPYYGDNQAELYPQAQLLGPGVGVFQVKDVFQGVADRSHDIGGNLEILSPDNNYPLGRIVTGESMAAELQKFLADQEVQGPAHTAPLDWLKVSHIDEVTSFLKSKEVIIADTKLAWQLISNTTNIPAADRHTALFFATGSKPQGGTASGSFKNRFYDGPSTGSITVIARAARAEGEINCVSEDKLANGEWVQVDDGPTAKKFYFHLTGADPMTGDVKIDLTAAGNSSADDIRDLLITAIDGVAGFSIDASADGAGKVKLVNLKPGTDGNEAVTESVTDVGFTVVGMANGGNDGILDGETVTLKFGADAGDQEVFEFDTDGESAAGNNAVDLTADTVSDEDVRDALATAINAGAQPIEAISDGSDGLHLWYTDEAEATANNDGNYDLADTVADTDFDTEGMSNGHTPWRDFGAAGTDWQFIRTFSYDGGGEPVDGQTAQIEPTERHNGWCEITQSWATTSWITEQAVGGSHFTEAIEGADVRTADEWSKLPSAGDKYAVCEGSKRWYTDWPTPEDERTPAIISVEEILADSKFKELNTTHIDDVIFVGGTPAGSIKDAVDNAMPGITYIRVPALFYGEIPGFAGGNDSCAALVPGPTNLQPYKGKYYVPRQYAPLDVNGDDIFEKEITAKLGANAVYEDCWNLYHRLDGEIHCGTNVKRTLQNLSNWWENQP